MKEEEEGHNYYQYDVSQTDSKKALNPVSKTLFLACMYEKYEQLLQTELKKAGTPPLRIQWIEGKKQNKMCLLEFSSMEDSLYALGAFQHFKLPNGKTLRISFTRSRMNKQYQSSWSSSEITFN